MNILLSILALPHLLILYGSFHLHLFVMPMIKEMMTEVPPDAARVLGENIVIKTAGIFAAAIDVMFGWWFVIIPGFALMMQVIIYILKKQSDEIAKVGALLIISFCSTLAFISLSAQTMTLIIVMANVSR